MGTQAKHHVAPVVRAAFLRAIERKEEPDDITFSEMLVGEIEQHGLLAVMDKVARYTERTSDVNVSHSGETLVSILTGIAKAERAAAADSSVEAETEPVRH